MKNRFIILVELNQESKQLLSFAQGWAKHSDSELLIVHQSFSLDPALGESEFKAEIRRRHRKDTLLELKSFVADTLDSSVPTKFHITTGNLEASILKLNNSSKFDILFAGLKGEKGMIERIFVTSTPIKLVDEVNKIIIAIPGGKEQPDVKTLIVGVNEKYPINEIALRELLSLTPYKVENIHLLSLLKPDRNTETTVTYLETLCGKFSGETAIDYEILRTSETLQGMKEYMQDKNAFLVIQKGSRTMFDIFRKFFVNDLVNYGQIRLIILPS